MKICLRKTSETNIFIIKKCSNHKVYNIWFVSIWFINLITLLPILEEEYDFEDDEQELEDDRMADDDDDDDLD